MFCVQVIVGALFHQLQWASILWNVCHSTLVDVAVVECVPAHLNQLGRKAGGDTLLSAVMSYSDVPESAKLGWFQNLQRECYASLGEPNIQVGQTHDTS